jgi:hypothetical protein
MRKEERRKEGKGKGKEGRGREVKRERRGSKEGYGLITSEILLNSSCITVIYCMSSSRAKW